MNKQRLIALLANVPDDTEIVVHVFGSHENQDHRFARIDRDAVSLCYVDRVGVERSERWSELQQGQVTLSERYGETFVADAFRPEEASRGTPCVVLDTQVERWADPIHAGVELAAVLERNKA